MNPFIKFIRKYWRMYLANKRSSISEKNKTDPEFKKKYEAKQFKIKNKLFNKFCEENEINEKMVIFESFMGRSYSDNPKALYEYMISNPEFDDYTFVWAFRSTPSKRYIPHLSRATLVKYKSDNYYNYYSQAKYFVTNSRLPDAIIPREGQKFIQTWHGTPLKRLGYDLTDDTEGGNALNSLDDMRHKYKVDSQRYSYLLAPSAFCTEKFTSCFNLKENNPDCEIIEEGYPRNDFLSNYTQDDITGIKWFLGLDESTKGKKIILYAPTWRDNQHETGVGYVYDNPVDFDYLQKKLSDDYIILFRAHYFVANAFDFDKYRGFIYDVSKYEDINHLYVISDFLVTDYSSVFFDYSIMKKPIIFYMYDLKEYQEEIRGFYFGLEELPGPIVQTEKEFVKALKEADSSFVYDEKYKAFNEKFTSLEDGNACKRICDRILKEEQN